MGTSNELKIRHLRSTKLGDLVFRADGKTPSKRRASVKLVYQLDSDEEVDDLKVTAKIFLFTIFTFIFISIFLKKNIV